MCRTPGRTIEAGGGWPIELWRYEDALFGLVVCCHSGVWWTNQAGGANCMHPEAEGVFIPLPPSLVAKHSLDAVENYAFHFPRPGMMKKVRAIFDEPIGAFLEPRLSRVDMLSCDVMEAWIPMYIRQTFEGISGRTMHTVASLLTPLRGMKGFLVWANSD